MISSRSASVLLSCCWVFELSELLFDTELEDVFPDDSLLLNDELPAPSFPESLEDPPPPHPVKTTAEATSTFNTIRGSMMVYLNWVDVDYCVTK